MTKSFGSLVFTPAVKALRERYASRRALNATATPARMSHVLVNAVIVQMDLAAATYRLSDVPGTKRADPYWYLCG